MTENDPDITQIEDTEPSPDGRPVMTRGPLMYSLLIGNAFTLLIICGIVVLALSVYNDTLNQIRRQRSGSTAVTCAVVSAVSEAGRDVIIGSSTSPDTPFVRKLEQLGYPSRPVRAKAAKAAADAYVATINRTVAAVAGPKTGYDLVRPNGQLNCHRFETLSGTRPTPAGSSHGKR